MVAAGLFDLAFADVDGGFQRERVRLDDLLRAGAGDVRRSSSP